MLFLFNRSEEINSLYNINLIEFVLKFQVNFAANYNNNYYNDEYELTQLKPRHAVQYAKPKLSSSTSAACCPFWNPRSDFYTFTRLLSQCRSNIWNLQVYEFNF